MYNSILFTWLYKFYLASYVFLNRYTPLSVKKAIKICRIRALLKRPLIVSIEITNACNSDCIMCPRRNMKRGIHEIDFAIFKKIVDECVRLKVKYIYPYFYGEPFLVKDIGKYLKFIREKSKSIKINFATNASILDANTCNALIDYDVNSLIINIDGATEETYNNRKRGLSLKEVEKNIYNFIKIRKERNVKHPRIFMGLLIDENNKNEIAIFKQAYKTIADYAYVVEYSSRAGSVKEAKRISPGVVYPCFRLWSELNICNNADVPLCCNDYDCVIKLGNVINSSIYEIWTGDKLKEIRKLFLASDESKIPLCVCCSPAERDLGSRKPFWW